MNAWKWTQRPVWLMKSLISNTVRFFCFMNGILFAGAALPFSLLSASVPQDEPFTPSESILIPFILLFFLHAGAFLYVGVMWSDIQASWKRRILAGGLLMIPFISGMLILSSRHTEVLWLAMDLSVVAGTAFVLAVWLGIPSRWDKS